jgi:hypothetical protein
MTEEWKVGRPNKSDTYILPMLGHTGLEFMGDKFPMNLYRNCFIGDNTSKGKKFEDKIFILYKFSGKEGFDKMEEYLKQNAYYLDSYDPDYEHVMYVFNIPIEFEKDYHLFKEGKYSQLSDRYKQHIMKFHALNSSDGPVQVMYKVDALKSKLEKSLGVNLPQTAELSSVPDMGREIYQDRFKSKKRLKPNPNFDGDSGNIR